MLAIDLGILNKKSHAPSTREAVTWSLVWIAISLGFAGVMYMWLGHQPALEFLTAYVIEKSLSVDNLFVFIMIFSYFKIPVMYQHRVLFWGIIGALIMRAIFIGLGVQILESFHWIIYIFGLMLVYSAWKMLKNEDEEIDFNEKWMVKLVKRFFPVTSTINGKFFNRVTEVIPQEGTKRNTYKSVLYATPLFIALVVVEVTDLVFAVDSIPAVLAISSSTFVIYTSNIFAILWLRSLYFCLSIMVDKFTYLKYGVSVVLAFVGVKMLISGYYHVDIMVSLGIILTCLVGSVLASYLFPSRTK